MYITTKSLVRDHDNGKESGRESEEKEGKGRKQKGELGLRLPKEKKGWKEETENDAASSVGGQCLSVNFFFLPCLFFFGTRRVREAD